MMAALASLLIAGCASAPERVEGIAASLRMERAIEQGADFRHVVYRPAQRGPGALHVYIEGDGRPYLDRWTVAADPTPRNPLMLQLMALDRGNAIYVGRPCYFGLATDPPCSALDWTLARFSDRIVTSLAAVIEAERIARGSATVELYGHSGGGALAVLLAHRIPETTRIVTLAGNLDTEAWVALHHYSALEGSLNPARLGPLPARVSQQHYAGTRDKVIPAWMVEQGAREIGGGAITVDTKSHICCWEEQWPAILADHE
jgi:pimeloyl-ACP methyl ester carboxylesterase